jgi:hypothetical protein
MQAKSALIILRATKCIAVGLAWIGLAVTALAQGQPAAPASPGGAHTSPPPPNLNAKQDDGVTALLMSASENGKLEVVRALLAASANINARRSDGSTALMLASQNGRQEIVRALLAAKADVNAKRGDGSTALILASQNGHQEVAQLLKTAGAVGTVAQAQTTNSQSTQTSKAALITAKIGLAATAPPQEQQPPTQTKAPSAGSATEKSRDGRFIAYGDGTALDTETNLMWAAKDNGGAVTWANAMSYCEKYRAGGYTDWRMPSKEELARLYDKGKPRTVELAARSIGGITTETDLYVYLATALIDITRPDLWASDTRSNSDGALFRFGFGASIWVEQSFNGDFRVLPVRGAAATRTPSGLVYRELKAGTGPSPIANDRVTVRYRGTLEDGTEFDSSYKRNEPAQFRLDTVIPCWTEGIQRMKIGGKSQLVCPPALAYGEQGVPRLVPGGATLIFVVELLSTGH